VSGGRERGRERTDSETLLTFAEERGRETAEIIAGNLDAAKVGVWQMLPNFIRRRGGDAEFVDAVVHSMTSIRGVYSGKRTTLEPRLRPLEELAQHGDPVVRDVGRQAKERLLRKLRTEM
jgi:hypothetical protein